MHGGSAPATAFAAAFLCACGALIGEDFEDKGKRPSPGEAPPGEVVLQSGDEASFFEEYCRLIRPCCEMRGYPADTTSCKNYIARYRKPDRTYSSSRGARCLEELRVHMAYASSCFGVMTPSRLCEDVYEGGTTPPGEVCRTDSDCSPSSEGDTLCRLWSTSTSTRCQIVTFGEEGDDCDTALEVHSDNAPFPVRTRGCRPADDVYCDVSRTKKCVRLLAEGSSCDVTTTSCSAATYCDRTQKKCMPRLAIGAKCEDALEFACADSAPCDPTTRSCTPPSVDGEPCSSMGNCLSLRCMDGRCESSQNVEDQCGKRP